MKEDFPEDFEFLTNFDVEAEYVEDGHHHKYAAPVIRLDKLKNLQQIRFVLEYIFLNQSIKLHWYKRRTILFMSYIIIPNKLKNLYHVRVKEELFFYNTISYII